LALDTQLNIVTLKRAAQALEKDGYISRTVRPNHSNKFSLNMGKIQQEALANRAADAEAKAARQAVEAEENPFPAPAIEDIHDDNGDEVEVDSWNVGGAR